MRPNAVTDDSDRPVLSPAESIEWLAVWVAGEAAEAVWHRKVSSFEDDNAEDNDALAERIARDAIARRVFCVHIHRALRALTDREGEDAALPLLLEMAREEVDAAQSELDEREDEGSVVPMRGPSGGIFDVVGVAKSLGDAFGGEWGWFHGGLAAELLKGAGHKYIRRVPTGRTTKSGRPVYRYFYRVTGGAGIAHDDEIKDGAAFKITHDGKVGHLHVTAVDDSTGKVLVRHDESGQSFETTKDALRKMVHGEHAEAIGAAREKAKADVEAARKHGTPAQVKAREAEAAKVGAQAPAEPTPEKPKFPQRARVESLMRSTLLQDRVSDRDRKLVTQVERLLGAIDSGSASYTQQLVDAMKADGKPPRPMQQELRDEAFALARELTGKGGAEKVKDEAAPAAAQPPAEKPKAPKKGKIAQAIEDARAANAPIGKADAAKYSAEFESASGAQLPFKPFKESAKPLALDKAQRRVSPFTSKDETRQDLMDPFVKNGNLWATDGHRIVGVPVDGDVKDGWLTSDNVNQPPQIDRVMPKIESSDWHEFDAKALQGAVNHAIAVGKPAAEAKQSSAKTHRAEADRVAKTNRGDSFTLRKLAERFQSEAQMYRHGNVMFTNGRDGLALHAVNPSNDVALDDRPPVLGRGNVPVEEKSGTSNRGTVALNAKYLAEALKGAKGTVRVYAQDAFSPMRIEREDGEVHVIMPMRADYATGKTEQAAKMRAGLSPSVSKSLPLYVHIA